MVNYTDIPSGEEEGLALDNISVKKKDSNFFLKLACVGLLCVVAFMSGAHNAAVASLVNTSSTNCQGLRVLSDDKCIQVGAGLVKCLDKSNADAVLQIFNELSEFSNWEKGDCEDQGYTNYETSHFFDIPRSTLTTLWGYDVNNMGLYFTK